MTEVSAGPDNLDLNQVKKRGRPRKEDQVAAPEVAPEIAGQEVFKAKHSTLRASEKHPELWKEYQQEQRPVKGKFLCHNPKHGTITFHYRKYPWESITKYTFEHGQTYTVPLGVARHVQNNCEFPEYQHSVDVRGKKTTGIARMESRMDFIPLDFDGPRFELRP